MSRPVMHRVVVALCLAALAAACADLPPDGLERGVSRVLSEIRSATLDEIAYDVELVIPGTREAPIEGAIEISFVWDDAADREVVLDFKDPEARVRSVTAEGRAIGWRAEDDHLILDPDDLRAGAMNRVRVVFTAGDEALNRHDDYLYTLFVPDRAHFSLPLFDQPDLKARVSWTLTVPEGWVAVANGPDAGVSPAPADVLEGGQVHAFAPTRPISTYLMAFAAGRFSVEEAVRDGRRYRMFHRETDVARVERNRDEIFDLVAQSMAWMEDYTGIEHPFAKHDFVLIPSFQYGGMEHPGAVFYQAASLMLDEGATQNARLARASLIGHETAHMWFGNLVTMHWFDDVWMKEVFANFLAAKMVGPAFPEVNHDLRFLLAHHPAAYEVDRTAGTNAIRQPLDNLREAGTLYGAIIYQKAPIVMRQLELRVGERLLQAGLRIYLADHAYGTATWPDLIRILDERVPGDLEAWSRAWVDEPGRPTLELRIEEGMPRFVPVVVQRDPAGRGRLWPQELLLVEMRGLLSRVAASIDVAEARQAFPQWTAGDRPRWILPNGRGIEYGLFVLGNAELHDLLEDASSIPDPLLRGSAWLILHDALLEGQLAPTPVLAELLRALEAERDELLIEHLIGNTTLVFWSFLSPGERAEWAARVEATFERGWRAAETVTLRSAWFQGWRRVVVSEAGVRRLHALWAGEDSIAGLPFSEEDRTALAVELAVRGVPQIDDVLDRQRARIENPDRQARFDFIRPALDADERGREAFFASLADADRRANEPWVLAAVAALNHPLRQDHARQFLRPGLELLEEIQATGDIFFPGRWLDALLGGHQTAAASSTVTDFLRERPDLSPPLRAKVLQAHDRLQRAAAVVAN